MEAILLAGGMGTRLRSITGDLPKPMVLIKGKPFLNYILNWISKYPINRINLSLGYKAEVILKHFGPNFKNIPIKYIVEDQPLGTGGAIKFSLTHTKEKEILIINADTYFPIDINKLVDFHRANNAKLTIALKKMEKFDRYGTVELNDNKILRFNEKQFCENGLINGGIYLLNPSFINSMSLPKVFSFEKEVLEIQADGGTLNGIVFAEPFIDIGIPEDYYRASEIV